ncbi:MAG: redoxin domain-containing protein [Bacteroidota bacterium]
MRPLLVLLFCIINLFISDVSAQSAFPLKLQTIEGEAAVISPSKSGPYTVLVFLLPDCPACQSYTRTLSQLQSRFAHSGVRFIGIFAGKFSKKADMISFQKEYPLPFPLYVDTDHSLIQKLDVKVSPEVVVLDPSGTTRYQGRIDDWMYAVGKKRSVIRNRDLEKALEELAKGHTPKNPRTTPIGCIIQ